MNNQVCLLIVAALAWSSTRGCGLYAPSRHNTLDYKAIHAAAESGDLAKVTILIKEDPRLVEAKDWANLTPLHLAVFHGHQDVVTFLLDKGANVNARTTDGITPLHEAAQIGSRELVELLLVHNADINAVDSKGWTPLQRAQKWEHPDVADLLRQNGGR